MSKKLDIKFASFYIYTMSNLQPDCKKRLYLTIKKRKMILFVLNTEVKVCKTCMT